MRIGVKKKNQPFKNCVSIFVILTILFPLFRVLGGFLTFSDFSELFGSRDMVFYWDQVFSIGFRGQIHNSNYLEVSEWYSSTALIWQMIHLWGPIWIILGLIGAVLVVLPAFQKILGQKSVEVAVIPVFQKLLGQKEVEGAKIGLILGLVTTGVEFGLFILAWFFSKGSRPFIHKIFINFHLNFNLLGCFVIGWVGLIIGYVFTTKE